MSKLAESISSAIVSLRAAKLMCGNPDPTFTRKFLDEIEKRLARGLKNNKPEPVELAGTHANPRKGIEFKCRSGVYNDDGTEYVELSFPVPDSPDYGEPSRMEYVANCLRHEARKLEDELNKLEPGFGAWMTEDPVVVFLDEHNTELTADGTAEIPYNPQHVVRLEARVCKRH
jgi:hypothetical protein